MNNMQVFSYQRFSSVKQGDGDSIRRQTKRRDDWLARHNLVLDEQLSYRDAGKSALRGRHAREGELADFLAVIDRGEVHKGDILIIEALDRLTRQKPLEAVGLVSRVLASHIRIVTLDPEREYDWDSANNIGALMEMVVILCRGNEESERKSSLSRRNWDRLRSVARNGEPITPTGPHWLRLVDGKWKEIPEAVAVVKRIVRMALDGYGTETIARILNGERVPTLRHGRAWCHSTIGIILRTPALIGGYQPKSKTSGKNTPVGDVIEGYYGKGIISKKEFYRLQEALDSRMPQGRTGATVRNIFKGLVRDLRGDTLTVVYKGRRDKPQLVSSTAKVGLAGTTYCSFRYDLWEKYFLREVKHLKPSDLLPRQPDDTAETDITKLEDDLADVDQRIATVRKRITTEPDFTALLDVLRDLDQRRHSMNDQLGALRRQHHQPSDKQTLSETTTIADMLETATDPTHLRIRLRALIRRLVARIQFQAGTTTMDSREWRYAVARVFFKSGGDRWILVAYDRRGNDECESWGELSDGIKVFTPDTLAARLALLPQQPFRRR